MLDKSVPYAYFYMRRKAGAPIAHFPLPDGYRYTLYNQGDEYSWARIETAVLEFEDEFTALMRFNREYMTNPEELYRRVLFIENSNGEKVASTVPWWKIVDDERRPWLHWVAVHPSYQGIGLGKAIISRTVQHMIDLEGDVDFYLRTQTWSYKAVSIYKANGFEPTDEKILYVERKSYKDAMKILKKLEKLGIRN